MSRPDTPWMTRSDVAKNFGRSIGYVRMLQEKGLLKSFEGNAREDGTHVHLFSPEEVARVKALLSRKGQRKMSEGELAAEVFEAFGRGEELADIVQAYQLPPNYVKELYKQYTASDLSEALEQDKHDKRQKELELETRAFDNSVNAIAKPRRGEIEADFGPEDEEDYEEAPRESPARVEEKPEKPKPAKRFRREPPSIWKIMGASLREAVLQVDDNVASMFLVTVAKDPKISAFWKKASELFMPLAEHVRQLTETNGNDADTGNAGNPGNPGATAGDAPGGSDSTASGEG